MGIQREWTDRQRLSNGELEVIGFWVMRQAALDRTHYAEVEAAHKRDIESMDDTLAYWKRQTLSAREESETAKTERDEANKWVSAYLLERNEAHEESERLQRRNDVQAETIDFLQKQNKTIRDERDKARDSARESHDYMTSRYQLACKQIKYVEAERDEARAEVEHLKPLVVANQNLAADRYMEVEKMKGNLAIVEQSNGRLFDQAKSLKGQLDAAEQEIKIVRAKVCELECKQAAREALKPVKSCGCRVGVPECCNTCQNAKLANEALDSLRFAR